MLALPTSIPGPRRTALAVAALAIALATPASAMVGPLATIGDSHFLAATEALQVTSAFLDVEKDVLVHEGTAWWVDLELTVRNISTEPVDTYLAILDEEPTTGDTIVWLDGVAAPTDVITPGQDPAIPEHTYAHARRVRLQLGLDGTAVVRVHMYRSGTVDMLGRTQLELPTHALGLFSGPIPAGRVRLALGRRAIGLLATIQGGTSYDGPEPEVTWALNQWEPRIPFRMALSTPWAALLLVAEVEACPAPWQVVRATTRGEIGSLRTYLDTFDDASLRFCGNLVDILHGRPFESERTLAQLSEMTLERYVPGSGDVPLYRPDREWTEGIESEAEAVYAQTLRRVLMERTPPEP